MLLYFPLITIIIRDFLVTILRKRLENKNIILKASFSGKMKTIFQLIFIHIYLLEFILINLNLEHTFGVIKITVLIPMITGILFLLLEFLILLFSFISGLGYLFKSRKILF